MACALLAVVGCTARRTTRGDGRPEDGLPPCPDTRLALDPVRGDVNATFLHAVLTEKGRPVEKVGVAFRVPSGGDTFTTVGSALTDATGTALYDLGALVLVDAFRAGAVARAGRLEAAAVLHGPPPTCRVTATAELALARKGVVRPPAVATDRAGLERRVRELEAAFPGDDSAPRLKDGSSACRRLWAVAETAAAHPDWLPGRAPRDSAERLREGARSCPSARRLAALPLRSLVAGYDRS